MSAAGGEGKRLRMAALGDLPSGLERPAYDPARLGIGIVHLGLGAFHRAHQAVYTDDVAGGDPRWGIAAVSLRTPTARNQLAPQDGLYTVEERSGGGVRRRVIGAVREALFAPDRPREILARLAAAQTRIVTLTVTEKGYGLDLAAGGPDWQHPDVAFDAANAAAQAAGAVQPRSVLGWLVAGLAHRRTLGSGSMSIVACDNLPSNGARLGTAVRALAEHGDGDLARWIADHVAFPSTVVDRIVPATTQGDVARLERDTGWRDEGLVVCEPFRQWVIESRFAAERPAWEAAGATLVDDVETYTRCKLRLLNASHSSMAYLGLLAGIGHVHEVMARPALRRHVERLMREDAAPTLPGISTEAYQAALLERFANGAVAHRTAQIAQDGSLKLPVRLVATAIERQHAGAATPHVVLAIAAWLRCVESAYLTRALPEFADPKAAAWRALAQSAPDAGAFSAGVLADWGALSDASLRDAVLARAGELRREGVESVVAKLYG